MNDNIETFEGPFMLKFKNFDSYIYGKHQFVYFVELRKFLKQRGKDRTKALELIFLNKRGKDNIGRTEEAAKSEYRRIQA